MLGAQVGGNGAPAIHRHGVEEERGEEIAFVAGGGEEAQKLPGAGLIVGRGRWCGGYGRGEGEEEEREEGEDLRRRAGDEAGRRAAFGALGSCLHRSTG